LDVKGRKLQKTRKNFAVRKFKISLVTMLLGDAITDERNKQRLVGNRKPNSVAVCTVA